MATEPLHDAHQGHEEPNALQKWLTATWEKLKSGQVGNPKWIALIVAVAAIGGGWWYLARSSKKADSALWFNYDLAVTGEGLKEFAADKSTADTEAARIARVNLLRIRQDEGVRGLTAPKLADRLKSAKALEEARDELTKLADEFTRDRTMKAVCLLAAADAELALVGVPKEGVKGIQLDPKPTSRGQVERVTELKRRAAEVVGPDTPAGQRFTADAEKYTKDAAEMYNTGAYLFAAFNEPDAVDLPTEGVKPAIPAPPSGITPSAPGDTPKAPDKLPDPVNPLKPDEKKPDDGPKPGGPLPPTNPEKK
jgi:hypothetical protein